MNGHYCINIFRIYFIALLESCFLQHLVHVIERHLYKVPNSVGHVVGKIIISDHILHDETRTKVLYISYLTCKMPVVSNRALADCQYYSVVS